MHRGRILTCRDCAAGCWPRRTRMASTPQYGSPVKVPDRWMEIHRPDIYARNRGPGRSREVGGSYRALATAFAAGNFIFGLLCHLRMRREDNNYCLQDHGNQRFPGNRNRGSLRRSPGNTQHFDAFTAKVPPGARSSPATLTPYGPCLTRSISVSAMSRTLHLARPHARARPPALPP